MNLDTMNYDFLLSEIEQLVYAASQHDLCCATFGVRKSGKEPGDTLFERMCRWKALLKRLAAENKRLREHSVLQAATINGLRLPKVSLRHNMTFEEMENEIDYLRRVIDHMRDADVQQAKRDIEIEEQKEHA